MNAATAQASTELEMLDLAALSDIGTRVHSSLKKVERWVEDHNYEAYER